MDGRANRAVQTAYNRPPRLLNLFAYSGVASLHAARAGAEVTHLDASKKVVAQPFKIVIYPALPLFVLSPMMPAPLYRANCGAAVL